MASWTENVHCVVSGQIRQSYRKHRLSLTKDVGASSESSGSILFVHGMHSSIGDNVAVIDDIGETVLPKIADVVEEFEMNTGENVFVQPPPCE